MSDLSKMKTAKTIRDSVHNLVIQEYNEIVDAGSLLN